jgi:hypothetical protein
VPWRFSDAGRRSAWLASCVPASENLHNIGLAGALVVPAGPALAPGISFLKVLHWSFAATQARSIDHFHFNARGPQLPEAMA